ncbi:MAG: superoxide dismutase family protein [Polyangiaceae bacterium]|nr:superoxide dismutase family protein [Myxococcales bacterium]MCB9587629.1 superoxide dismutase family protein [Polyangiaceae bacterium]MCB9605574.1 superoxide dismutase family protein [Polyangiaceae bacterium]
MKLKLNYLTLAAVLGLVACDKPDPTPTQVPAEPERTNGAETTPEDRASTKAEMNHAAPKSDEAKAQEAKEADEEAGDREAEAEFASVPNMKVAGEAELHETKSGSVEIEVEISGAPVGKKGLHIHQADNCSDIAGMSMGSHFAPKGEAHGLPTASEHHLGDLGNITIAEDGKGKLKITIPNANLNPKDPNSFIGKAIVLHEADDKGTGKSGDAGKPIACAPIKAG